MCGSDVHMWRGLDPRIRLPLVLGHEGVGTVEAVEGEASDVLGRPLETGDLIIWDRGITCGRCHACAVLRRPALCANRQVYGITRQGCYATHLALDPATRIITAPAGADPAALAAAACAGATVAHAFEYCSVGPGDTVVVQGPGPTGLFAVAFARAAGASHVIALGTERSRARLEMCEAFGADLTLTVDGTTPEAREAAALERSGGLGAAAVFDCTGRPAALAEGVRLAAVGGAYLMVGIATPVGETAIRLYEDVARKNLHVQGVWVSDTSHLYRAVALVASGRFPFERMVTHRFPLEEAGAALEAVESRRAVKAVLEPGAAGP
jgi:threonine dehydrogenase-like Zn-dependent dehydrogenase